MHCKYHAIFVLSMVVWLKEFRSAYTGELVSYVRCCPVAFYSKAFLMHRGESTIIRNFIQNTRQRYLSNCSCCREAKRYFEFRRYRFLKLKLLKMDFGCTSSLFATRSVSLDSHSRSISSNLEYEAIV